ncbi:putative ribonuclease D [Helianthus annuus]|uniref:Ribonuclease D n=1 Tax=Helianthus annuus TaxID=4232 RepID=A0A9K3DP72_HELAN|nr:protein RRP6-like 3 isoform X3 [Helianthus annuus]KAF5758660.1 putative ribonuclease D [Helianthus annuus]KAJ0436971.1 putative ribonuclease D [Helianthus annuus]KAJ0459283.1 putative ribonuclease D [Helianthus annuus]KAJ0639835.1 putative ribonuclease D [Helianthus annuus]KAJ0643779.1 putative ribonuclease D [Helianthus annuus]
MFFRIPISSYHQAAIVINLELILNSLGLQMENKHKLKIAFTVTFLAVASILLANKFRKHRKRKQNSTSCYLKSEAKPQHNFKRVLANNSYAPFKHLKLDENSSDLHPYESEIKALLEKLQLDIEFSNGSMDMKMSDKYVWVDDELKLKELVEVLSEERVFAVDTEQHSLRSFLGFTALIQISTRDEDYLVDTIAVHDIMGLLGPVFANPNICKVFHGADNDVIWLQRDFHIYVVNLFDTAKACDVLSKPQRSLAYLLETYCGVTTNKLYQREDWRQRPLPIDMVEYARMDAHYLLYIADCLVSELKNQKNENSATLDDDLHFVSEAIRRSNALCLQLFTKDLEASPGQSAAASMISRHLNDHGSSANNSQFQDLVRRLCCWRDLMARMHDESLKYVLSDNAIVSLAETVPLSPTDICTTLSQADIDTDFLNSNSTPRFPSSVVSSHLDDFPYLLQNETNNLDDLFQLILKKHIGPNGSCPFSLYNYGLLSKTNIKSSKRLVTKASGYKLSKQVARKASRELFVQKFSCKSPVYHNCRIYANDGRLLCYCDRRKLEWYVQRDLAKIVDEDPPAIMLLFEPKGRPEDEGNDFYIQSKKNICVGCGEGNHYLRYRIIPSCYRIHFPEHLKSHRSHDIVLVCVDCHEKAHSSAERYKKKVALEFGIPLFVHKVVNSNEQQDVSGSSTSVMKLGDCGVSPLELRTAAMALIRHGPRMPPQRREELKQVVKKYYGGREISEEDLEKALLVGMSPHEKRRLRKKRGISLNNTSSNNIVSDNDIKGEDNVDSYKNEVHEPENGSNLDITDPSEVEPNGQVHSSSDGAVFATCSSKLSLLGHGPHGKQVVDYLLKNHGEVGIQEFCQRWRQVFVESINPRFLPAGWDVTHSGRREFGDFSVYNPANKAPVATKD